VEVAGFGSATTSDYSDLEGPYTFYTSAPLVSGSVYEYTLRVKTDSFWHCSIYDPDGCSWLEGTDDTYRWRFTWTGAAQEVAQYVPAPPPPPPAPTQVAKVASTVSLSAKKQWSDHGWIITATLRRAGVSAAGQWLTGQWRTGGAWKVDKRWRTDSHGKLTLKFNGEKRPTTYRFVFAGNDTTTPAGSKTFSITARR
jgi:hypothetical protein